MAKATKEKRPRAEQSFIPGTEPVTIPEVEEAARAFAEEKENAQDAVDIRKAAELKLIAKMKANGITVYNRNGLIVTVESATHAKVTDAQKPKRDERHPSPTE